MKDGNRAPVVSIGMPVRNGERFVAAAIESVLAQDFENLELIVSDNGSTDATPRIVASYAAGDDRVRVTRETANRGAAWNFNNVLSMARGRYFKWQACDDLIAPSFLGKCVTALDADPEVSIAHTRVGIVDELGADKHDYWVELRTDDADPVVRFRELLLPWQMCFEVFGLIRMRHLQMTEGMGAYGHADGVLLAHLGLLGPFNQIDEVLFYSREHPEQSMRQFGSSKAGGNDYHAYAAWFDPSARGRLLMPRWRMMWEYQRVLRAVGTLSAAQQARCEWVLLRRMRADVRHLVGDCVRAGGHLTARAKRLAASLA